MHGQQNFKICILYVGMVEILNLQLGLARTSFLCRSGENRHSGRLFLGCAHGWRKKRCVLTFCSQAGVVGACATQARGTCYVTTCFTTIL